METFEKHQSKMRKSAEKYHKHIGLKDSNSNVNNSNVFGSVLALILLFFLIFVVFRRVLTGNVLTFEGFLNWLGSINSTPISINIANFTITADWSLFNWLRDFLNIFASLFGVAVYMCANLINLFVFCGQFVAFLFA